MLAVIVIQLYLTPPSCRDATREAKAHLELKLAKEIRDNKMVFF